MLRPSAKGFASEIGGCTVQSKAHAKALRRFKFAVNTKGKNKDWNYYKLTTGFRDVEGTLQDAIGHVKAGHALCAGLLDGRTRSKANVRGTDWLLLDIDNETVLTGADGKPAKTVEGKEVKLYKPELTLEDALEHPFIKQYCALIYTSPSHQKIPGWDKLRLVFLLPDFLEGWETVEELVKLLMEHLPHDPSCKDAGRVFYGNTKAEFPLVNPEACLPAEWLETARQRLEERKVREAEEQRLREERRAKAKADRAAGVVSLSTYGETLSEILEDQINPEIQSNPGLLFGNLEGWKGPGKNCWCPLCTIREDAPSFNVAKDKPVYICYGCSPDGGNYVSYVRERFGYSYLEAVRYLADLAGVAIPEQPKDKPISHQEWLKKHGQSGKGFGQPRQEEADPVRKRVQQIRKRDLVFRTKFAEALKQDFLLGKVDIEYEGFCPTFHLGLSRTFLIQGWLGAGKTEAIIHTLAKANPNKLIIWTTTRNGLLHQTLARCDGAGIVHCYHYQADVSGNRLLLDSGSAALVTMAVDSFKDYAVGHVNWEDTILVIDEFRSVRCEILSKPEAFPEFERALREAGTLIVADAFLSDADRGVLKQYRGKDRIIYRQKFIHSPKPIYWLESLTKDGKISFTHEGGYLDLMDQFIELEGRTAIAVDNLMVAKCLARYLRSKGKQVKIVSSETVESNQIFLPAPDPILATEQPDFLIYTPTAQAGLDVQTSFERGLLIATGVLSPCDMLQMLGRCRQCKEWYVSAPRFTGSYDLAPIDLDGPKVAAWGQKLSKTFEQLELQTSPNTHAWAEWQNATREIEKAFNSEYLRYLLEYFFASVETVTVQSFRTQEWRDLREAVQKQDVISTLSANLQNGQQITRQKRQPVYDHEVWDVKLAEHYARFPQVVDGLIQQFAPIKDKLNNQSAIQEWGSIEALRTAVSNLAGQLAELEEPLVELQEKMDVAQRIYAETPDADTAERLAKLQQQLDVAQREYDQVNQKGVAATSAYQAVRREESEIEEIIDIAKVFFSQRIGRLKNWRMAVRPDGLELLRQEVRSRFTNSHTQHWKQFVYTRLFTALNLGQLAKAAGDKLTPHKNSFNKHSQVIDELWGRFCSMAPVRELFPAVETKDAFWGLVRKVMSFMGFQSVSDRFRVRTDELHRNGSDRNGRQRYSRSQTQYFTGWLQMEVSGSLVFQEMFPVLVEAIDEWIEREQVQKQEYRDRQERQRQEAKRWEAAA